jgi:deoxyribose-phosphate aldolase
MKQTVGDRCQVKAAGGVKDLQTLLAMHERGVRRFGIGVRTARTILEGAAVSGDSY